MYTILSKKKQYLVLFVLALILIGVNSCKKKKNDDVSPGDKDGEMIFSYEFSGNFRDNGGNGLHLDSASSTGYTFVNDNFNVPNRAISLSNGKIVLPNSSDYRLEFPFTLSMWVKVVDSSSTDNRFFYSDNYYYYSGYWFQSISTGGIALSFGDGLGNDEYQRNTIGSSVKLRNNRWHHIVGIIKGPNNMALYIDGVRDQGATYSGYATEIYYDPAASAGQIGALPGGSSYLNGSVDRVRLWDYALSESQVKNEYNEGRPF